MRLIAALIVCLSFFATHAAGEAFSAGPTSAVEATADSVAASQDAQDSEDRPCQQGECLFILPAAEFAVAVGVAANGAGTDASAQERQGRMVHPPPIS